MTEKIKDYLKGFKKIAEQTSYDVDEKYGRVILLSKYVKSTRTYKVPLGELFYDYDKYENSHNITIKDFYIIAKGCGYIFKNIKKETYMLLQIQNNTK